MQSLGLGLSAIWLNNAAGGGAVVADFIELEDSSGKISLEDATGLIQLET